MSDSYALGVDLGSKFTAAAVCRGSRVEVVQLGDHAHTIPSVVCRRPDGTMLVGDAAQRRAVADPRGIATDFKRDLGDDTPRIVGDVAMTAVELLAHLLRHVLDVVTAREGSDPDRLVLTCPASWGAFRRAQLADVARTAGRPDAEFLDEPVAAAVHYASLPDVRVPAGTLFGVYDLGGATFDVAVVRKTTSGFLLCGRPGGADLGGMDFDEIVFSHVRASMAADWPDSQGDPAIAAAFSRLRPDTVAAKESLSYDADVSIPVTFPGCHRVVRMTREEFEGRAEPLIAETVELCLEVADDAGVSLTDLDRMLLIGGASRMPAVARLIGSGLPGVRVQVDDHPKWAVCLGAAIVAGAGTGREEPSDQWPDGTGSSESGARPTPREAIVLGAFDSDFAPELAEPSSDAQVADAVADSADADLSMAAAMLVVEVDMDGPPEPYDIDLVGAGLAGIANVVTRPAVDFRRAAPPAEAPLVVELTGDARRQDLFGVRTAAVVLGGLIALAILVAVIAAVRG